MQPENPQLPNSNPKVSPAEQPNYSPTLSNLQPESPTPKRSLKFTIIAAILILTLAGGVFAYYYSKNSKKNEIGGTVSLNGNGAASYCIPIIATSLDKASAITTYERFAKAVAAKNQKCANDLSTSFFLSLSKQKFGAQDGNWITAKPLGLRPISDDFSQLPSTYNEASFKQTDYTRSLVAGSSDHSTPTGTTLSYPVDLSKYTGNSSEKWQISISFILENGNIRVDDFVVEPQQ